MTNEELPCATLEHIKNNRSKHQYENLSRGTKRPGSVEPKTPGSESLDFLDTFALDGVVGGLSGERGR